MTDVCCISWLDFGASLITPARQIKQPHRFREIFMVSIDFERQLLSLKAQQPNFIPRGPYPEEFPASLGYDLAAARKGLLTTFDNVTVPI